LLCCLRKLKNAGILEEEPRFSGKNRGNLVRFTCRVSTSVSAKSVLMVVLEIRLDVMR